MTDEAIQIQLRCSNCGRVVATLPQEYHLKEELVCPGCGVRIEPPGVIGKIAGELRDVLAHAVGQGDDEPEDKGSASDRDQ